MRRYLQGTLDFDCALYALINALSCTRDIALAGARHIYQETMLSLSACPRLWEAYVRNGTDQYWMIRHLASRWCGGGPWHLRIRQPFGDCLLPDPHYADLAALTDVPLYLPEAAPDTGGELQTTVWDTLAAWLGRPARLRAVIFRFHRFLPGLALPVVSHWTCGARIFGETLVLHDASGEENALHSLEKGGLLTGMAHIAPESVLLLESYLV